MIDLCVKKRFTTGGAVYEYRFEIASVKVKGSGKQRVVSKQ